MEHFNKLTPAEAERIALLAEECGEVIQVIGKILRHGKESYHPEDSTHTTNREHLQRELGDVLAAISLLQDSHDLDPIMVDFWRDTKINKVKQYLHHQD